MYKSEHLYFSISSYFPDYLSLRKNTERALVPFLHYLWLHLFSIQLLNLARLPAFSITPSECLLEMPINMFSQCIRPWCGALCFDFGPGEHFLQTLLVARYRRKLIWAVRSTHYVYLCKHRCHDIKPVAKLILHLRRKGWQESDNESEKRGGKGCEITESV